MLSVLVEVDFNKDVYNIYARIAIVSAWENYIDAYVNQYMRKKDPEKNIYVLCIKEESILRQEFYFTDEVIKDFGKDNFVSIVPYWAKIELLPENYKERIEKFVAEYNKQKGDVFRGGK